MDKELLRKAFEAGEEYNKEKGFCEPDENFDEWYENKVKNLGFLADVSNCSACGIEIEHKGKCEVCHCKGLEAYGA